MLPIKSRKVRKIVKLEAQAQRLLARYEHALQKAVTAKAQAHRLLDQAHGLEVRLTGSQLGELRRARAEVAAPSTSGGSATNA
jgi:hypothetical protein